MASIGLVDKPNTLSDNSEKLDSSQCPGLTNKNSSNSLIKEEEEDKADSPSTNVEESGSQSSNVLFQKEETDGYSNILIQPEIIENDDQGKDVNRSQEIRDIQSESSSVDIRDIEKLSRQLLVEGPISQIVHKNEVSIRLKVNKKVFKKRIAIGKVILKKSNKMTQNILVRFANYKASKP